MWCLDSSLLCRAHLIAEHGEIHSVATVLKNRTRKGLGWICNLLLHDYLGGDLKVRHDELVHEMLKRGYKHLTPMPDRMIFGGKVDVRRSKRDLMARCEACKRNFNGSK